MLLHPKKKKKRILKLNDDICHKNKRNTRKRVKLDRGMFIYRLRETGWMKAFRATLKQPSRGDNSHGPSIRHAFPPVAATAPSGSGSQANNPALPAEAEQSCRTGRVSVSSGWSGSGMEKRNRSSTRRKALQKIVGDGLLGGDASGLLRRRLEYDELSL